MPVSDIVPLIFLTGLLFVQNKVAYLKYSQQVAYLKYSAGGTSEMRHSQDYSGFLKSFPLEHTITDCSEFSLRVLYPLSVLKLVT
ncbi:hypothetical protein cypCar_00011942 [Cyprinus carpio]|nr:hypothetical protein cypCar_00011942 [Cyprinus carpio]